MRGISWRIKLPLLLVAFSSIPLGIAAYLTNQVIRQSYERTTLESLETLAQSQGAAVEQFSADRQSEVERIAQLISIPVGEALESETALQEQEKKSSQPLPVLVDAEELKQKDASKDKPKKPKTPEKDAPPLIPQKSPAETRLETAINDLRQQLGLVLWDQTKFEEFLIMGVDGEVLVSTFQQHESTTAANLEYFRNGLGATYVQPVFKSPITDRLTMVISTPIRNNNAQVIAVLAARLNLSKFFRLINETAGLGETGETVVGKLVKDQMVLMAPTRHAPDAVLDNDVTIGKSFGILRKAALGQRGRGKTDDYRARCVYAAWQHIPSLNWALAVKLDCDEALRPAKTAYDQLIRLLLLVSLLALFAALIAAHALVAPLNALRNAADSISRGNFDVRLPIPPGDEMGDLADSFERMIAAIKFFRAHSRRDDEDLSTEEDASLMRESMGDEVSKEGGEMGLRRTPTEEDQK